MEGVGADILVQPPGSSFLFGLSQAPMPIKIGDRLAEIAARAGRGARPVSGELGRESLSIIYGIDLASFDRVSGGFVYHAGGPFQAPYDILVDDVYAKANHAKVGQTLQSAES